MFTKYLFYGRHCGKGKDSPVLEECAPGGQIDTFLKKQTTVCMSKTLPITH